MSNDGCATSLKTHGIVTSHLPRPPENPRATTRVDAAKRAVNFVRSLAGAEPLEEDTCIRLLARSARNAVVRTVRQSPALPAIFVKTITSRWGTDPIWWKRQTALMVVLGVCTVARGAEVIAWRREGLAWVRRDGTQVSQTRFKPHRYGPRAGPRAGHVRGFMLLFPSRKNKQSTPSWIPVISATAVLLLSRHLQWLDGLRTSGGGCLFPARVSARIQGQRLYNPATNPESSMSVNSLRALIRLALRECCGLSAAQADQFGTHCLRVGAIELLRQKGVPAELRQQLGGWMSASSALGYLQLPVGAQFDLLQSILQ